jgi:hypothetical protein
MTEYWMIWSKWRKQWDGERKREIEEMYKTKNQRREVKDVFVTFVQRRSLDVFSRLVDQLMRLVNNVAIVLYRYLKYNRNNSSSKKGLSQRQNKEDCNRHWLCIFKVVFIINNSRASSPLRESKKNDKGIWSNGTGV